MRKELIKYVDYNGETREEEFYFNLNRAELLEMELSVSGGLDKRLKEITETKDGKSLNELFKNIILKAYGIKSEDGRRFIKSAELSKEFEQTEAYSELIMKLITDADFASSFINGIIPSVEELKKNVPNVPQVK